VRLRDGERRQEQIEGREDGATRTGRPVAIVGMACRLPGAPDLSAYWDLLRDGGCSVGPPPADRPWPGAAAARGGFLEGIAEFDPRAVGMSAREAVRTDPRHRLVLETVWEAFEDAGLPAERLAGSRTGVFVSGCLMSEYWDQLREAGLGDLHALAGAGMFGTAAGRVSHLFDLRGPSLTLDGTCAGGLMALHLAVQSLRTGESTVAVASGVNVVLAGDSSEGLASGGVLSKGGLCRFGDAGADGYVRSEGAVSVVVKLLTDALAQGDRIHGVLLGSAVSNDGRSGGTPMTPGAAGQETALRDAYRDAGVRPEQVQYVEAHGTGTALGDQVELVSLGRVVGGGRRRQPCLVGSVKSNIGHTEATAGLAGVVKTLLAIHHRTVPPTLHVAEPNPVIAERGLPLELVRRVRPWPEGRPLAGVSSFGLSGVDAHVVLTEGAPAPAGPAGPAGPVLIPVSANSPDAVRALAGRYRDALRAATTEDADPSPLSVVSALDVGYTAGHHRSHHRLRAAVVAGDRTGAVAGLTALAEGVGDAAAGQYEGAPPGPPRVVLVFPGQGGQWAGMGADLLRTEPVFAAAFRACDRAVRDELDFSPVRAVEAARPLRSVDEVQPAIWALQVALATLWRHRGVEPDELIGHSMGEIAAATVAGGLTVAQGARVVCRRARLLRGVAGRGAMAAVQLDERSAATAIAAHGDRIAVGVVNSSTSCVLSGDPDVVDAVLADLTADGVFCRRLAVDYASHGPQMAQLAPDLRRELTGLAPGRSSTPIRSTVRPGMLAGPELDADYWIENLCSPVRFAPAVRDAVAAAGDRHTLFVELSPHPTLVAAVSEETASAGGGVRVTGSLHREDPLAPARATAQAYVHGVPLRWDAVQHGGTLVDLPTYPWQRRRHWVAPAPAGRSTAVRAPRVAGPDPAAGTTRVPPGPADVTLAPVTEGAGERLVLARETDAGPEAAAPTPTTALRTAFAAATDVRPDAFTLEAVEHPALGTTAPPARTRTTLTEAGVGWGLEVHAVRSDDGTVSTAAVELTATLRGDPPSRPPPVSLDTVRQWCTDPVDAAARTLLPGVEAAWSRPGEAVAVLAGSFRDVPGFLPPDAWLDPCCRLLLLGAAGRPGLADRADVGAALARPARLAAIGEVRVWSANPSRIWCHVRVWDADGAGVAGDARVLDDAGRVLCDLRDLRLTVGGAPTPASLRRPPEGAPPAAAGSGVLAAAVRADPGPPDDLAPALTELVVDLLQIPAQDVTPDIPLTHLGLDSLLATELAQRIRQRLGIVVASRDLLVPTGIAGVVRGLGRAGAAAVQPLGDRA
jgi:acyl transferase domain-containing protein/acyl carrier protein